MNAPQEFEIPGAVEVVVGQGGLTKLMLESSHSEAELYLHGAHLTHFQRHGEEPILFVSGQSEYHVSKPIRGGVPVIFPWFGARPHSVFHGFARVSEWELVETAVLDEGAVQVRLRLPTMAAAEVELMVTISDVLTMELRVTCTYDGTFTFEDCLHSYFRVGDVSLVEVHGLQQHGYYDQLLGKSLIDESECIRIIGETDRIYHAVNPPLAIVDRSLGRVIRIATMGSASTVVWNPWIEKSRRMADFGDDEYIGMICVESGNVREFAVNLSPGETASLVVQISSELLDASTALGG